MRFEALDNLFNEHLLKRVGASGITGATAVEVVAPERMQIEPGIPSLDPMIQPYQSRGGVVFEIPRVSIFVPDSLVLCQSRFVIVEESTISRVSVRSAHRLLLARRSHAPGVFGVYRARNKGYYHQLVENLQRLFVLSQHVDDVKLLIDSPPSEMERLIASALFKHVEFHVVGGRRIVRVDGVLLPTYVNHEHRGFIHPAYKQFVDEAFPSAAKKPERVFISRNRLRRRDISNEEAVLEMLGKYGFKSYHLEDLSPLQQIGLFRNAQIVIGAHGAGLSNILFCGPATGVVEISPMDVIIPHYYYLSRSVGADYRCVLSQGDNRHATIAVDVGALEKEVRALIACHSA